MSQDVKLLPLPELPRQVEGYSSDYWEAGQIEEYATDYARANMEPLIAENERLRAEVARQESLKEKYIFQSDGWEYKARASEVRAERLAEALKLLDKYLAEVECESVADALIVGKCFEIIEAALGQKGE